MHACMLTHMLVHTHSHSHTHAHAHKHIHSRLHKFTRTCPHAHAHMHILIHIFPNSLTHVPTVIYSHTHLHAQAYSHRHVHAHTRPAVSMLQTGGMFADSPMQHSTEFLPQWQGAGSGEQGAWRLAGGFSRSLQFSSFCGKDELRVGEKRTGRVVVLGWRTPCLFQGWCLLCSLLFHSLEESLMLRGKHEKVSREEGSVCDHAWGMVLGGGELVFSCSSGSLCGPRSWHPESFASDWCLGLQYTPKSSGTIPVLCAALCPCVAWPL